MEDNKGLCARPARTMIFKKVVRIKEGERHHLKVGTVKMKIISNLCVRKKVVHKDHARRT
jgi:hypothetical protein